MSITSVLFIYCLRLVQLQVFQYDQWLERSESNHQSKHILDMKRGTIYDRNGAELALSVETYTVFVYTPEIKSFKDAATVLSTVLPMNRDEILAKINHRKGYLPIIKNLERGQATKLMSLNIKGVTLEENYRRIYPQNNMASNLIGFCGADGHGLEGLELSYDRTMRGYPGMAVQEDVSFTEEGPPKMRVVKPPAGGSNMYLTIDSFIQHLLETELAKLVEQYKPIDASALVMDPYTGEILGLACLPNYDLNAFAESPPEAHRNRPLVDVFEPGSCMKIFAAAAALINHKIDSGSRFYCRGYVEIFGRRIKCHGTHGLIDLAKVIAESCNASMVQISQMVEPRQLYRAYREFGFGEPTGLEVPSESQGMFSPPSRWSGLSAPSLCIGQEIAVTGIQLVTAYSAIANGGWLLRPHLVRRILSQTGDIDEEFQPERRRQVFSPAIAAQLRQLLQGVVDTGTGKLAATADYTIGGKTSTAQKANPHGGYYHEKVVANFIGLAPATKPRIVLLVAVNEPKGDEKTLFGGKVAGPAFGVIADRILKYLKVPPDKTGPLPTDGENVASGTVTTSPMVSTVFSPLIIPDKATAAANTAIPEVTMAQNASVVPDLSGLTLRQVASIAQQLRFPVQFEGNGVAVEQKPLAGFPLNKVTLLNVRFSPKTGN